MKILPIALAILAGTGLPVGVAILMPPPAEAQGMPVFDTTNYAQNLLQASRALEQINNQLTSLQNEATMLDNMARNLRRIVFPELDQLKSAMQRIDGLIGQAQGIDFRAGDLDRRVSALFPGAPGAPLSRDSAVAAARARLDAAKDSVRRAIGVQAQIAENVHEDSALLADLASKSQDSAGVLQAQQSANQLAALSVKQQLQLQQLMASEFRSSALDRARRAQAEEEGRSATGRFLGDGHAYAGPRH
jgi:P-type conjugative transfer protein TrbJ